jgi:hypothetical protein
VKHRTIDGQGCPYCSSKIICFHNSLQSRYPKIAAEWHPSKNLSIAPWQVAPATPDIFWWKCRNDPCGCHEWEASVNNRTTGGYGCPYCASLRLCQHNNLYARFPEIAAE